MRIMQMNLFKFFKAGGIASRVSLFSLLSFAVSCTGVLQDRSKREPKADYSNLGNQEVDESSNPTTTELPFKVNVPEGTSPTEVQAWAKSSNTSIVPDPAVEYDAATGQFKIKVIPVAGKDGEVEITVYVRRNSTTREHKFKFTVLPVNDPPVIDEFLSQTIPQDTSLSGVTFAVSDEETTDANLITVTATSSNQTLLPNANINLGGTGANRTLAVAPVTGQSGSAVITVKATDPEGNYSEQLFTLTVTPSTTPPAPNTAPTISTIADQTILEDGSAVSISFNVGDAEQAASALTVTASSSNQTIIPNSRLVLSGSGANRSIDVSSALNQNGGPVTITVTVSDGGLTATETFDVTVTPVNDAPTISSIANQTVSEDTSTGALAFTISDLETAASALTLTATSNNQSLVPDGNITLAGSNGSRTIAISPAANATGTAAITVTVSDGSLSATRIFNVTFTGVNDAPTISNIADATFDEDTNSGALSFTVSDIETAASSLTISATSSNTTLVPNANITFGGSGGSRTVTVTPAANQNGSATITVTLSDGSLTATDTFLVTVNAIDDAPTISNIANQTTNEDTATNAIAFTVSDAETAASSLVVTATSSDTALVPNGNITLGGTNGNRTITITPAANLSGTSTITVTVSDGSLTATDTFDVTVSALNDAPTISSVSDQTISEDQDTGALSFTVGDLETDPASLTMTGTSSNTTLVPNANIVFGGSGANRTVTVTPAANQNGTATITLTVSDGSQSTPETFLLTVSAVNDAPTISDITNQSTSESTALNSVAFTVSDIETAAGSLTVTGTSSDQSLIADSGITFGGSAGSRTVTLTPVSGQSGSATITLTVSDGSLTDTDTFVLTVGAVDDPPTISNIANQTTSEDTATGAIAFTVGDPDTALSSLSVSGTSSNQTIVSDANIVFGGSNGSRTVTITPEPNQTGTVTITVNVTDGTSTTSDTFTLTINSVNDAPTISDISNDSTTEETPTSAIAFTVGDTETAAASLTVSGSSSDTALVPNANIVFGGSGANRTVTITPATDKFGSATITITVSDGTDTASDTFTLTVTNVNDAPTISNVADQSTTEETATGAIAVTLSDSDTDLSSLTLTGTSSNQTLIDDANIVIGGTNGNRTVTLTPLANQTGTATITLTVSDGSLTATDTFVLTVTGVNDAPTISDISDTLIDEDDNTGALSFTIADEETAASSLTVTGTSSNTTLVPNANITFGGSGANRTVTVTPAANQNGTATITVTVSDGSLTGSDTFALTVNAVNDAPTISDISNQTTTEDTATGAIAFTIADNETASSSLTLTATSSNQSLVQDSSIVFGGSNGSRTVTLTPESNASGSATITVTVSDGSLTSNDTFTFTVSATNDAPTISNVADQSTNEDTATGAISVTVGDAETGAGSLTLSATSSNQTLVPDANITFGGSGANRTVTVTPAANQNGTVVITLSVSDGTDSTTDTFNLTINAVNDAPTISDISNQSTSESTTTGAVSFTISDVETAASGLTVTASSSNQTLLPNANITLGGSNGSRTITMVPATGESGSATVTVEVSDGSLTAQDTFTLTVGAVDDPPTISDVANQTTNEDTATGAIAITVTDPDTTLSSLTMTGSSSNQTLVPDANIVFGGSNGSRTVTLTPAANQNGTATITLTVSDGTSSVSDTFTLTVSAVNDAPTISDVSDQSTDEETATTAIAFTVSDVETAAGSLTVTGTSSNTSLVANSSLVFGGSGSSRTVTITPELNQSGTTTITLTVSDGTLTSNDTFTLTVSNVNDAPTISDIANQTTSEDTATSAIGFTVSDLETAASSLTVTATSSDTTLVPNANITLGGSGGSRTVTVTPAANQSGVTTITVTVSDGSLTANDAFTVTVNGVNDAPTISDIANQTVNEDTATAALSFTIGDQETAAASLTVSGSSSNTSLVPNANITFAGSGSSRTVTVTPASNQFGTATITVTVSDGTDTATDTFTITVNSVNDAPTISDIANQTVNEDVATSALAFTISDVETAASSLTVTGTSSNTALVPNANIVFGGSGASRTVTVTPASNENGTATITVSVSDGTDTGTDTFTLTVSSVNDAPTISDVANQTVNEDVATSALAITIGDQETAAASLTMSGSSNNTTLVPNANIVFGGSGSSRTVTVTPALNQSGTATITLTVSDGTNTTSDTFVLTVNAVDDAPTFVTTIDDVQVDEDTTISKRVLEVADVDSSVDGLTFTATSSNASVIDSRDVTYSDQGGGVYWFDLVPGGNASGTTTITISYEYSAGNFITDSFVVTVDPVNDAPTINDIANQSVNEDNSTSSLSFTVLDTETASASLSVSATSSNTTLVPNANLTLGGSGSSRTIRVTPASNQFGTTTITVTVSDGSLTASDTFSVTVASVNDAPTITNIADQTIARNSNTGALAFTIGDVETAAASLTLSKSSSNTTLVPSANIVFGGSGASRTVTITPATNKFGTATITVTVSDGSTTSSDTIALTVTEPSIETNRVMITLPHKNGFKVSKKDKAAFKVTGTCNLANGQTFAVTDSLSANNKTATCSSGKWSVDMDFSSASTGATISIYADAALSKFSTSRTRTVTVDDSYCGSTEMSASPFAGGAGTSGNPYTICTATQFNQIRNYSTSYFSLKNTIDLSDLGANWTPNYFSGVFYGNDFIVKNLTIVGSADYAGMFMIAATSPVAIVQDLHLYNVSISNTGQCTGPISHMWGTTHSLSNFSVHTGTISSSGYGVGGLVGCIFSYGTVTDGFSDATVSTTETTTGQAGGIVGRANQFTITRGAFMGTVSGTNCVGGVVGGSWGTTNTVQDSLNTGSVTVGSGYTGGGGIVGCPNTGFVLSNNYSKGSVSGGGTLGGLLGASGSGTISYCYASGAVSGSSNAVGFGNDWGSNTVTSSYFNSTVAGTSTGWLGTAKTSSEFKDYDTFTSWDFSTKWTYNYSISDTPILQWWNSQHQ